METQSKPTEVAEYESRTRPRRRGEEYYPSDTLKRWLNEYTAQTGVFKSELAVRLMRSFFAARRKEGRDPSVIELLPEIKAAKPKKLKGKKAKRKKKKAKANRELNLEHETKSTVLQHF